MEKLYDFLFKNSKKIRITKTKKFFTDNEYKKFMTYKNKKSDVNEYDYLKGLMKEFSDERNIDLSFIEDYFYGVNNVVYCTNDLDFYSKIILNYDNGDLELKLINDEIMLFDIFSEKKKIMNSIKETENSEVKRRRI